MDRFDIAEVLWHAQHAGKRPAASHPQGRHHGSPDKFSLKITGRGGHAAEPHNTADTIVIGAQIVSALQTIAARNANPLRSVVVSVTQFHAGTTHNIIPEEAFISGTVGRWTRRSALSPNGASVNSRPGLPQLTAQASNTTSSAPAR